MNFHLRILPRASRGRRNHPADQVEPVSDDAAPATPWRGMPALGHKRLDAIKSEDVQHLKSRLSTKAAKTVNNILTVLNVLLKKAVDRRVQVHC